MHKTTKTAFTLMEVIFALLIIGVLTAIIIPNFMEMEKRVRKDACINHLMAIKLAKEQWALENNKGSTDTPTSTDLDTYIKSGTASLYCPLDTGKSFGASYTINRMDANPICKIEPTTHKLTVTTPPADSR